MNRIPKEWKWEPLPPDAELESSLVLKKALEAQRFLSELKGISQTIPNQTILLSTLPLQEAKDSSEIENIVTTNDELFKANVEQEARINQATKEVKQYAAALNEGFKRVRNDGILTVRHIKAIQEVLEENNAGIRKLPGTQLTNPSTGEVIFVPPQDSNTIEKALANLEEYINNDNLSDTHPLIKMAVIHLQFESIHPFYDGNGRTGRILNMLYLVLKDLLDLPVLYLSRYIVRTKEQYYRLLQQVREEGNWEDWILYMLEGVVQTSSETVDVIHGIHSLMMEYKHRIRDNYKFYSQDLINHLFKHPYTKISHMQEELELSRPTAQKYLDTLAEGDFLYKVKKGRDNYFINHRLLDLLVDKKRNE